MTTRETTVGIHWENFVITSDGRSELKVTPSRHDSHPSEIGQTLYDAADPDYRALRPMVRESYRRGTPGRIARYRRADSPIQKGGGRRNKWADQPEWPIRGGQPSPVLDFLPCYRPIPQQPHLVQQIRQSGIW